MRSLIFAAILFASANVFAESVHSEFFWQPDAGMFAVTPSFSYGTSKSTLTAFPGETSESTSTIFDITAEYGINQYLAIGIGTDFGKSTVEFMSDENESSGMGDIELFGKGSIPIIGGALKVGTKVEISPENKKLEANGDRNRFSGQTKMQLMAGYEANLEVVKLGGRFSYTFGFDDQVTEDASGYETRKSGGESFYFVAFVEVPYGAGVFGGTAGYSMANDTRNENTGVESEEPPFTAFSVYATYDVAEAVTLTGNLGYAIAGSTDQLEDGSVLIGNVGMRFAF